MFFVLGARGAMAEPFVFTNAWVRATPPGATTAAVYLSISSGSVADTLIGESSDVSATVEIHVHEHRKGMMRMKHVERLVVTANSVTTLSPGNKHLMLIDISKPLIPGNDVHVTLMFAVAGRIEIVIPIQDARQ